MSNILNLKTMKMSKSLLKLSTIICFSLLPFLAKSQLHSSMDGNWDNASNWSNGVPGNGDSVNIKNNLMLDSDININNSGSYKVTTGSINCPVGGKKHKINIKDFGYLEVSGNVFIEGDFKVEDNGELVVRDCDTLIIGGSLELNNNSKITLEECAVIIVKKDLKIKNNVMASIDGNIVVDGRLESKNDATISGIGYIEAGKKIDIKNNSSIFGSTVGCNKGPCTTGSGNPLPIVLGAFEAAFISTDVVEVKWETLSEVNNDFFTLYYSTNGETFVEAKRIQGAGNSHELLNYKAIINGLSSTTIYLKLKQTDFDGKSEEFNSIVIHRKKTEQSQSDDVILFPNPGDGNSLFLLLKDLKPQTLRVMLFNSSGEQILTKPITNHVNENSLKIELLNGVSLKKGLYIVRVISPNIRAEKKYIVH